jgi:N6-adenosine-specific RNA methylase IME4
VPEQAIKLILEAQAGWKARIKEKNANNIRSVQLAKRGSHSAKPSQIRDLIEQVSPAPYLEMFGRETVKGWTVFGNQVMQTLDGYVPDQLGEGKLG